MIRYTFHFEEGSVKKETDDLKDQEYIESVPFNQDVEWFTVAAEDIRIYINKAHIKCIIREEVQAFPEVESETRTEPDGNQ